MVSLSLRLDFMAFSMWLMFSYNFELCILSFLLILVFTHKWLSHSQIKPTGMFLRLFWLVSFRIIHQDSETQSTAPHWVLVPAWAPPSPQQPPCKVNCFRVSHFLSPVFAPLLRLQKPCFPRGGEWQYFLNAYPPENLSADLLCCLFVLVHRCIKSKDLSACKSLADRLLQYFSCLT